MAKNTNTVAAAPVPNKRQQKVIDLATRQEPHYGVTRAEVRKALGFKAGANIPVQTMIKQIADRFGYVFDSYDIPSTNGSNRSMGVYTLTPKGNRARNTASALATKAKRAARKVA